MRINLEIDSLYSIGKDNTVGEGELIVEIRIIKNKEEIFEWNEVFKGMIKSAPYQKIKEVDFKHVGSQEIAILHITEQAKHWTAAYRALLSQYPAKITRENVEYAAALQSVIASGLNNQSVDDLRTLETMSAMQAEGIYSDTQEVKDETTERQNTKLQVSGEDPGPEAS